MTPEERADAIAHAVMRSVIIEGRKLTFEDVAMRIDALSHLRAAIAEEREACAKIVELSKGDGMDWSNRPDLRGIAAEIRARNSG